MMTLENPFCTCDLCCPDLATAVDYWDQWIEARFNAARPTAEIAESIREGVRAVLKEDE